MTTEWGERAVFRFAIAILTASIVFACAGATRSVGPRGGLSEEIVRTFPPQVAESYELFARRCSRCHTLSRPLTAGIEDFDHWKVYVARMRRQPGSGISLADADKILVFLKYFVEHRDSLESKVVPGVEEEGVQ